jgi:hypothetical protein
MARVRAGRPTAPSPAEMHRSWLELVDIDGPFLAIPPLKRVWPNGIPDFRSIHPDRYVTLADARKAFEAAWESFDKQPEDESALTAYREVRDGWVQNILRDVIGWQDSLAWGEDAGIQAQSPNHAITIAPQAVLRDPEGNNAALVFVVDPVDSLRETPSDGWAATPVDRLEELLRASDVPIGIVTDGRWWGIVSARTGSMPASGVVDSLTWIEEPRTRDAFLTILGRQYLIGGDPSERLSVLFEESIAAAEEITEALGVQVRQAVELLVQAFSESAAEASRRGLPDPLPDRSHDVYEAAVTVMMRTVFLLFAEERGLLPTGELFEQGYGLSGELDRLARREVEEGEEALDATSLTWHRLLATSAALYGGATFESLRMPAYGGSLFDPTRFPFMTATTDDGTLAATVSDRVMLHVLRSVQLAVLTGGEARRISFRDIDVEQIGYIYEGLLGYATKRVHEPFVGLTGTAGSEPEIPLMALEQIREANSDSMKFAEALRAWIAEDQPAAKAPSASAIAKGLNLEIDASLLSALSQAVAGDEDLRDRIKPFLGIIRQDLRGHPSVVVSGGLLVKETPSRKNAGAHYTPKSLAEEVVLHALQPLCYLPGPHQTANEADWKLRSSDEVLDLKVADIACGSGAFLVAAARYLAERVVEAWLVEDPDNARRKDLHVRAIRQVVANCLYGADINEMAVEMAKLSLWLVSLDRDLPFSFVDDKIFLGNSLLGLTSLDQLRSLHIAPASAPGQDALDGTTVDIDGVVRKAIELRERLATEIDLGDPMRSTSAKLRQLEQLHVVTSDLRVFADGVIAAGLRTGGRPGKALDVAFQDLRLAVKHAQPVNAGGIGERTPLELILAEGLTPIVETDYERWKPLHWVLEAPDVFIDHGGFDAVVGNPPFLAGKKIATAYGSNIEAWAKIDLGGLKGSADLCAHFIRRGWRLLRSGGSLGLIGNDRVGQGDTSAMSCAIIATEGVLYRAVSQFKWPGSAQTWAAMIWGYRGGESYIPRFLDGEQVSHISSSLAPGEEADLAQAAKLPGPFLASLGVYVYGEGFVLEEADPFVQALSAYERRHLKPFVNGESLLSGTSSGRLVICVDDYLTEAELARNCPLIADHLRRTVKPVREAITSQIHEARYWAHWDQREDFFAHLSPLASFIASAKTTRIPIFLMRNQEDELVNDAVVLFATEDFADLGVLSSSIHFAWFEETRTPRGKTSTYTVSRVFRTFPFPEVVTPGLRKIATEFSEARERERGASGSYTRLHSTIDNPSDQTQSVRRLRELIVGIDSELLHSYGWDDLTPIHEFDEFSGGSHFGLSAGLRREVRRRLLELNLEEASQAVQSKAARKARRKSHSHPAEEEGLF